MRDLFPSLYVLAFDKDATIADYCHCGFGACLLYTSDAADE